MLGIASTNIDEGLNILGSRSHAFAQLRKESLDLYNRLHSIAEDSLFVEHVRQAYTNTPILANLRCGAWYTNPKIAVDGIHAYFKSTDGHFGSWGFSLRRPNLHLLPLIIEGHGLILVDSTRAGKRIPDALSKTVPIWCTVINRAVLRRFPDLDWKEPECSLFTPPGVVSAQEHHQITTRLDAWVDALFTSSYELTRLPHPLRPFWITPSTSVFPHLPFGDEETFLPIICVSASRQVHEGMERRASGYVYIQGSGDDHDLWGQGLTPQIFWKYRDELLSSAREGLPVLAKSLVTSAREQNAPIQKSSWVHKPIPIKKISDRIMVWSLADMPCQLPFTMCGACPSAERERRIAYLIITANEIDCSYKFKHDTLNKSPAGPPFLCIAAPEGKRGQIHFLQTVLPKSMAFIASHLEDDVCICISCDTGTDTSIGVALAALQTFFDNDGTYVGENKEQSLRSKADKQSIRTRLQWIITSQPTANPSRTTLKRVNEFLLSPQGLRQTRVTSAPQFLVADVNLTPAPFVA